MARSFTIERAETFKKKPLPNELGFGIHFTDHMFMLDYESGKGWHHPRIVPYQPITLDPAAKVFHYGQTVFEGLKAYRTAEGRVLLFRPDYHAQRLNRSFERLSVPRIDEEMVSEAVHKLVDLDREWIPSAPETSLYIRPFVIATEPALGVAPATAYRFMIIMSPVGSYYKEGIRPVKIYVEDEYVRAVRGGVGAAKTAGNYAASLKAQQSAAEKGYSQVLWLDGVHRRYIEEVGSMNVFLKIDGTVVTPALNGSILDGVTRNSVLALLRHWNIPVEERDIAIDEVYSAGQQGLLEEAFGTGTAAVISPIGELGWQGERLPIHGGLTGPLSAKLYDTLTGIQKGTAADPFGWTSEVEVYAGV